MPACRHIRLRGGRNRPSAPSDRRWCLPRHTAGQPGCPKAIGVRMGSGKGAPEGWVAPVKRGKVMFEIAGVSEEVAREALRLASHKLPVKTKFVKREAE